MLFRTASGMDYYRFALTCDGTARVDRVRTGTSSPMQPAVPPAMRLPARPARCAWASGRWATSCAFSSTTATSSQSDDPLFGTGTLGFFARSNGENDCQRLFSDLVV